MNFKFEQHASEDELESYALNRLDDESSEVIEEHLLICDHCRTQLDLADKYVNAMRMGAAHLKQSEANKRAAWASVAAAFRNPFSARSFGWAAAAVLALFFVIRIPHAPVDSTPVAVSLLANRGEVLTAPAHRMLSLDLDARGLSVGSNARVELVDAQGKSLESMTAAEIADKIAVRTRVALNAGNYYVRVYGPGSQDAVREFGLNVK